MATAFHPAGRTKYKIKYKGSDGRWVTEATGLTDLDEATARLAIREGELAKGAPIVRGVGQLTLADAYAAVAADYVANHHDSTAEIEYRYRLHLAPYFGASSKIGGITTGAIRAYIAHRLAQPVVVRRVRRDGTRFTLAPRRARTTGRATINRELALLKRMINLGIENGALLHGAYVPSLKESNTRQGFFERDQFEAICHKLDAPVAAIMRVAYITGWRVQSELQPLEWSAVDFNARVSPAQVVAGTLTIAVGADKNEQGRVFPFTAELRRVLLAQRVIRERCRRAGHVTPYVFVRVDAAGRPSAIKSFRHHWRLAAKAAGVPGHVPHDFRRTAARNLVRAGTPETVAMRLTGHKTRSVFERYNIVSDGDLAAAAARIDAAPASGTKSGTKTGPFRDHSGNRGSRNH